MTLSTLVDSSCYAIANTMAMRLATQACKAWISICWQESDALSRGKVVFLIVLFMILP